VIAALENLANNDLLELTLGRNQKSLGGSHVRVNDRRCYILW
jgi:hypothetical protein